MSLAARLTAAGAGRGEPVAVAVPPSGGVAVAIRDEVYEDPRDAGVALQEVRDLDIRWVWWNARDTVPAFLSAGVPVRACWDLAAVGALLHGTVRTDAAAIWAAAQGLPEPPAPAERPGLLDFDFDGDGGHEDDEDTPVRADGHLARSWHHDRWQRDLPSAAAWAALALRAQARQSVALAALPDPRREPRSPSLRVLTAQAESAAAVLAVELEVRGLPLDVAVAARLLEPAIGARPVDEKAMAAGREARDDVVRRAFPGGEDVDLRNPAQVRQMLTRVGLDLPDTRSWRLTAHAAASPAVAALLAWRKAERLATTYGWTWLDRHVGADGRLRGQWSSAEGAGRMTASAGLHNLPAELRDAVRAEPGQVLVRADLGQVEPRVLAVVSGDPALAAAAAAVDLYAPVAERIGCDRATAKVAMLAAMYGQTSGAAGSVWRQMERSYPEAIGYLRAAEEQGRVGGELRTWGGRLLRLRPGWGRFARNAVVQGAAAELFKAWAATVRVQLPAGAEIVLCLHDELLVQAPSGMAAEVGRVLRDALAWTASWWAAGSGVRFAADVGVGPSWPEAR